MIRNLFLSVIIGILCLSLITSASAQTPVEKHGKLSTSGPYILDEHGKIVQLRGMSFFWTTWFSHNYSKANLDFLVDSWKCTVVRVAYGNGSDNWSACQTVIDAAIAKGIYVIIDYHSHTAHDKQSAAVQFFTEQATKYKNTPNVIFEPYNEPITVPSGGTGDLTTAQATWTAIKPYLQAVTNAIRNAGADNLVIVGTPYYCQYVGVAAGSPLTGKNIAYTFHFYAASHGPNAYYVKNGSGGGGMEAQLLSAGLGRIPIFVTEWGTTHSDGGVNNSYVDETNTDWWFTNHMNGKYHISHCNWSVLSNSDDGQKSACFSSGTSPSQSGAIAKRLISSSSVDSWDPPWVTGEEGPAKDTVFKITTDPGTIPAWQYNAYYGANFAVESVPRANRDAVDMRNANYKYLKVSSNPNDNWISYSINLSAATKYIEMRYLALDGSGTVEVFVDGTKATQLAVTKNTVFTTVSAQLNLAAGNHTVKFKFVNTTGSFGYEWVAFSNSITAAKIQQHILLSSAAKIQMDAHGFTAKLPAFHRLTSYSLIRADGKIARSGVLNSAMHEVKFDKLSSGLWQLKLDEAAGSKIYKAIVTGK